VLPAAKGNLVQTKVLVCLLGGLLISKDFIDAVAAGTELSFLGLPFIQVIMLRQLYPLF
jgi:hypothetical protein